MAVNAKFQADFTSFYDALQKADVQLKTFESGAASVEKQLTKMSNGFSGVKVIQDAHTMTAAMLEVGGTSALTDKEMRKLGATVSEASDKMKRMGLEVPPGFKKITDEVKQIGPSASSAAAQLNSLASALGITFSIAAIVNFGRELLRMGDDIVRTADRTGLLTDEVQQLSFIAKQSGNSLEELVSAIGQMQNRLASGDKSAVAAVKALNISFDELRKAGPYQQLLLIADAVAKIEDPAGRAQVAMDLFGKSGIAILPTLQSEFRKLGDEAPKMSHNTVKALDDAGDALEKFKLQVKVFAAESYNFLGKAFDQITSLILKSTAGFLDIGANLLEVTNKIPGATKLFPSLGKEIQDVRDRATLARDAAKQLTTATSDMGGEVRKATPLFTALDGSLTGTEKAATKAAAAATKAGDDFARMAKQGMGSELAWQRQLELTRFEAERLQVIESRIFANRAARPITSPNLTNVPGATSFGANPNAGSFAGIGTGPASLGNITFDKGIASANAFDASLDRLSQSFANLALVSDGSMGKVARSIGTVISSVELAGQAGKDMKAGFQSGGVAGYTQLATGALAAAAAIDQATNSTSKAKNIAGGAATGAKAGMAFGPYGALIGAGVGAVVGWAKSNALEGKTVSPLRDEFFKMNGELEALNPRVFKLTGNLKLVEDIFKSKNINEYNAAIKALNDELAYSDQAMATLSATTEKYGFTLAELGPTLQRQELDKKAQELYQDFQVLNAAGIDHVLVLDKMADSINTYVQNALSMGVEVPNAMKPMLDDMAQQGLLTDAAGNKITNLEEAGISFALSMSEGFKSLITSVEKLTDAISRGLGLAIQSIPDRTVTIHAQYDIPDMPNQEFQDVPGFASGTRGKLLDFGAGRTVRLHGKEGVVTAGEAAANVAKFDTLEREVKGLRSDIKYLLPKMIRDEKLKAS